GDDLQGDLPHGQVVEEGVPQLVGREVLDADVDVELVQDQLQGPDLQRAALADEDGGEVVLAGAEVLPQGVPDPGAPGEAPALAPLAAADGQPAGARVELEVAALQFGRLVDADPGIEEGQDQGLGPEVAVAPDPSDQGALLLGGEPSGRPGLLAFGAGR